MKKSDKINDLILQAQRERDHELVPALWERMKKVRIEELKEELFNHKERKSNEG